MNFTRLHKLGSASSEVIASENTYRKIHRFATNEEAETVLKDTELLQKSMPDSIELPISCRIEEEDLDSGGSLQKATLLHYEQAHLKPWIEASWISSAQLEELGELIIKQRSFAWRRALFSRCKTKQLLARHQSASSCRLG